MAEGKEGNRQQTRPGLRTKCNPSWRKAQRYIRTGEERDAPLLSDPKCSVHAKTALFVAHSPQLLEESLPGSHSFPLLLDAWLLVGPTLLGFREDPGFLHLLLETSQSIFKRFVFLDHDSRHSEFTPFKAVIGASACALRHEPISVGGISGIPGTLPRTPHSHVRHMITYM